MCGFSRRNIRRYIITVNADGELVDIAIDVIKTDAGERHFVLGGVEHENLDSLVGSLSVEGALAELTDGRF